MTVTTYRWAITQALHEEMSRDPNVFLIGEDVARSGGAFGMSRGLLDAFGEKRVRDTPIAEEMIVGLGTGAAAFGLRPVVEIQFMDFLLLASDMLLNHAAKIHYMTAGEFTVPLTVRCLAGGGFKAGPQHAQSLEAMLLNIPGLKVVMPSTPGDAKGLLKAAIREDNPVVVMEQKALLGLKGEVSDDPDELVPLGRGAIRCSGSDVTVVALGRQVPAAVEAAEVLAGEGIHVEVIDPRTLVPLDTDLILTSVAKTGRLVTVHDAARTCGFGAEVAALVAEQAVHHLKAGVRRVTGHSSPVPVGAAENHALPGVSDIIVACRSVVKA